MLLSQGSDDTHVRVRETRTCASRRDVRTVRWVCEQGVVDGAAPEIRRKYAPEYARACDSPPSIPIPALPAKARNLTLTAEYFNPLQQIIESVNDTLKG